VGDRPGDTAEDSGEEAGRASAGMVAGNAHEQVDVHSEAELDEQHPLKITVLKAA
jgi:hypothetical protein